LSDDGVTTLSYVTPSGKALLASNLFQHLPLLMSPFILLFLLQDTQQQIVTNDLFRNNAVEAFDETS
jgi:hypothetical protein